MARRRFTLTPWVLRWAGLLVLIGLVWWMIMAGWWGRALQPLTSFGLWLQQQSFGHSLSTTSAERDELRQQVAHLTAELADAQAQVRLSHDLDLLTTYTSRTKRTITLAQVISHQSDPGIDSIVIGVGSADGITVGLGVIDAQGLLIGKVTTVRSRTATVLLMTDHQSVVVAEVGNAAHSQGVVRGEHGLSLRLDFLPKTDTITLGQAVATSGTEPGIPAGIPIGSISSIATRSGDVFQSATVLSPIEPQADTVVGVVRS